MKKVLIPVLATIAALAVASGCKSDPPAPPVNFGYERSNWVPASLDEANALAAKVVASKITCGPPSTDGWSGLVGAYQEKKLPMPGASVTCTSDAVQEHISFEVFDNEIDAKAFVAAKAALICERGAKLGTADHPFTGLPYVDGGTWVVEPDSGSVAIDLAPIVGGTAANMCPGVTNTPLPQKPQGTVVVPPGFTSSTVPPVSAK